MSLGEAMTPDSPEREKWEVVAEREHWARIHGPNGIVVIVDGASHFADVQWIAERFAQAEKDGKSALLKAREEGRAEERARSADVIRNLSECASCGCASGCECGRCRILSAYRQSEAEMKEGA